ncbi:MAG: succinylglutamate-semialdehyde dehydrogenase [Pseudomonadota bacterium]
MSGQDVYVNGAWSGGQDAAFASTCPASGEIVWQGHAASPDQVTKAVAAARSAFPAWASTPQVERTRIIEAYGQALAARKQEIAETISRDMGKALWDSLGEAGAMAGKIGLSIKAQAERAGTSTSETAFGSLQLSHRPHGVMAVFGPFNFPGHLPNGHIVPALLAGNTCVFKPSELAPAVARIMVECFESAGLPEGCLNVVHGGREAGGALLEAEIDGLLFTGSAATGCFFHKHFAGRPEILLALEMGGNNPLIVWDPADIDAAADIAAQGAFLTTGQRCSCTRRLILPEGAWGDTVVDGVIARAEGLKIGGWNEEGVFMGPLVSPSAAAAAVEFQSMLEAKGGRVLKRLEQTDPERGFVSAGVVDVTDASGIPDEELFGPVLQVSRVRDFDSAIAHANDTRYGLAGGLVCDDDMRWVTANQQMRAGILNRNRPTAGASGAMPFGGPGLSGNQRPSAYYAADYCAWPVASQVADRAVPMMAQGFPSKG